MLSSHSPIRANETNAANTISAARQPPKRSTIEHARRDRAGPGEPEQHVVDRGNQPLGERAEAVEDREDDVRVLGRALLEQPGLEARRGVRGSSCQISDVRPGELAAPERNSRRASAPRPPPPAPAGRASASRGGEGAGGAGILPLATAIWRLGRTPPSRSSTASRSTTPTTRPFSMARTGPSVAATTGIASLTVVLTSSSGPPGLLARPRRRA